MQVGFGVGESKPSFARLDRRGRLSLRELDGPGRLSLRERR